MSIATFSIQRTAQSSGGILADLPPDLPNAPGAWDVPTGVGPGFSFTFAGGPASLTVLFDVYAAKSGNYPSLIVSGLQLLGTGAVAQFLVPKSILMQSVVAPLIAELGGLAIVDSPPPAPVPIGPTGAPIVPCVAGLWNGFSVAVPLQPVQKFSGLQLWFVLLQTLAVTSAVPGVYTFSASG